MPTTSFWRHPATIIAAGVVGLAVVGPRLSEALGIRKRKPKRKARRGVSIFGATWCPACMKLKEDFEAIGVAHTFRDIDTDKAANEFVMRTSEGGAIPVVTINGQTIIGYNRAAIEEALDVELPAPAPPIEKPTEPTLMPEGYVYMSSADQIRQYGDSVLAGRPFIVYVNFTEASIFDDTFPLFLQLVKDNPKVVFVQVDRAAESAAKGDPFRSNVVKLLGGYAGDPPASWRCLQIADGPNATEQLAEAGESPPNANIACADLDMNDPEAVADALMALAQYAQDQAAGVQQASTTTDLGGSIVQEVGA